MINIIINDYLSLFFQQIIINKNMKNKKNKSINYPSKVLNNIDNCLPSNSKEISVKEEKKYSTNKTNAHNYGRKQKTRQINSLDELSKKFIKCVFESESNTINLNTVMKKIKVKKRRIYDITNVLEGKYK